MDRITHASAVETMPAATPVDPGLVPGYFGAGSPNGGARGTVVTPEWANGVQEEMISVLEAGGQAPDRTKFNQLLLAINALINNAVQTTLNPTGKLGLFLRPSAPPGWVRLRGRTIGSAQSGATERANSDCHALFVQLWNACDNTICPVLGGRGANAEADWAANKELTLPNDEADGGLFWRAWSEGSGRGLGSYQADGNKAHSHTASAADDGAHGHTGSTDTSGAHNHTIYGQDTGDAPTGGASNELSDVQDPGSGSAHWSRVTSTGGAHSHAVTVNSAGTHTHAITVDSSGNSEVTVKNRAALSCIKL